MAVKYYSEFKDLHNSTWRIEVSSTSWTGGTTELKNAGLTIDYEQDSNQYRPIIPSQAIVSFISEEKYGYRDLVSDSESEWLLIVYKNTNHYWQGWVTNDTWSETYVQPPYVFTVRAQDGLKLLKGIPFSISDDAEGTPMPITSGTRTIISALDFCLSKTGLTLGMVTINNIIEENQPANTNCFSETLVRNLNYCKYEKVNGEERLTPISCWDVLEAVLKPFGCVLRQEQFDTQARWVVIRVNEIYADNVKVYYYQGTALTSLNNSYSLLEEITTNTDDPSTKILFRNQDQVLSFNPVYSSIKTNFEAPVFNFYDLIRDPNFEDPAWTDSNTLINWTVGGGAGIRTKTDVSTGQYSGVPDSARALKLSGVAPVTSTPYAVLSGMNITLSFWTKIVDYTFQGTKQYNVRWPKPKVQIKVGTEYLYLQSNNILGWTTTPSFVYLNTVSGGTSYGNGGAWKNTGLAFDIQQDADFTITLYPADTIEYSYSDFSVSPEVHNLNAFIYPNFLWDNITNVITLAGEDGIESFSVNELNVTNPSTLPGITVDLIHADESTKITSGVLTRLSDESYTTGWKVPGDATFQTIERLLISQMVSNLNSRKNIYQGSMIGTLKGFNALKLVEGTSNYYLMFLGGTFDVPSCTWNGQWIQQLASTYRHIIGVEKIDKRFDLGDFPFDGDLTSDPLGDGKTGSPTDYIVTDRGPVTKVVQVNVGETVNNVDVVWGKAYNLWNVRHDFTISGTNFGFAEGSEAGIAPNATLRVTGNGGAVTIDDSSILLPDGFTNGFTIDPTKEYHLTLAYNAIGQPYLLFAVYPRIMGRAYSKSYNNSYQ